MKTHSRLIGLFLLLMVFAPLATADASIRYEILPRVFPQPQYQQGVPSFLPGDIVDPVEILNGWIEIDIDPSTLPVRVPQLNNDIFDYSISIRTGNNTYSWTKAEQNPNNFMFVDLGVELVATSSTLHFVNPFPNQGQTVSTLAFEWDRPGMENPVVAWKSAAGFRDYQISGVDPPPFGFDYADSSSWGNDGIWVIAQTQTVPEPAALAMWSVLGLCGAGLGVLRRKAKKPA